MDFSLETKRALALWAGPASSWMGMAGLGASPGAGAAAGVTECQHKVTPSPSVLVWSLRLQGLSCCPWKRVCVFVCSQAWLAAGFPRQAFIFNLNSVVSHSTEQRYRDDRESFSPPVLPVGSISIIPTIPAPVRLPLMHSCLLRSLCLGQAVQHQQHLQFPQAPLHSPSVEFS